MERKIPKKVDRKRFVRYKEGAEMYSMLKYNPINQKWLSASTKGRRIAISFTLTCSQ